MIKLNDKIKEFWEDAGYTIYDQNVMDASSYQYYYWIAAKKNDQIRIAVSNCFMRPRMSYGGFLDFIDDGKKEPEYNIKLNIYYQYNGRSHSENEMLRIIKLKAFL